MRLGSAYKSLASRDANKNHPAYLPVQYSVQETKQRWVVSIRCCPSSRTKSKVEKSLQWVPVSVNPHYGRILQVYDVTSLDGCG